MSYAGGAKFLLCQVMVGNTYKMKKVELGCKLKPGYHSHSSPDGSEIVSLPIIDNSYLLVVQRSGSHELFS